MNGRNRHNKYRRSVYRRRSVGLVVLIAAITAAVLLAAFLIIGNLLHAQSEDRENDRVESESTDTGVQQRQEPKSITGLFVPLVTTDTTFFSDRLDAIVEAGVLDASVPLSTADGKLLFKSSISDSIGYPSTGATVSLESAATAAKDRGVYLSGILYVNAFATENTLARSVELSKVAAVAAEALTAGFDEVVIVAPQMTEAHIDEAIRLVKSINELADGGTVGLAVSDSILSLENKRDVSAIIDKLHGEIALLALDLSGYDGAAAISETVNAQSKYLHMYKMRVILPHISDENGQAEIIAAAENYGIKNWQQKGE